MVTIFLTFAFLRGLCILVTSIVKNCIETYHPVKKIKRTNRFMSIYFSVSHVRQDSLSQYGGREKQFNLGLKYVILTLLGCQEILDMSSFFCLHSFPHRSILNIFIVMILIKINRIIFILIESIKFRTETKSP